MNYLKKFNVFFYILFFLSPLYGQSKDIETGKKLILNEKYKEAHKYFLELSTIPDAQKYFYLGEIVFTQKLVDSAEAYYLMGITADQNYPLNYAGLVKINLKKGNSVEIQKNIEAAIELAEDDRAETYRIIGDGYFMADNEYLDKAMEFSNYAVSEDSRNKDAYISLGKIYLKKGNGTEAVKLFEKVLDLYPDDPEALRQKAIVYILSNNNDYALSILTEITKIDSSYAPVYYELAEYYSRLKNYPEALKNYKQYISLSEKTSEKQKEYANYLYLSKEYAGAIEELNEILANEPDNPVPVRITAYSYLRLGDTKNSMAFFKRLFEMDTLKLSLSDYENYAELLDETGNDSLAINYLLKVVEIDSTREDVLSKVSILYFKNKNWNEVIHILNKKNAPTIQEIFDLGKAFYFAKDSINADTTFSKLIAVKPDLPVAYSWKARIKALFDPESEQGLAKPFYEKFTELAAADTSKYKEDLVEAYSYLGYYYYIKNDKNNSRINWEKVAAIDPLNAQAQAALKMMK